MKITADREQLIKELKRAISFIEDTPVIPIFDSVLLSYSGDGLLEVITSSAAIQYRGRVAAKVSEPGKLAIPAKLLMATISLMREPQVIIDHTVTEVATKKEGVKEQRFQALVYCGKLDRHKISCHNPDEYGIREIPNCPFEITFDGSALKDAVDVTASFCSSKDGRVALQGINVTEMDNDVTFVGTDSNNLGKVVIRPRSIVAWAGCIMITDLAKLIKKAASDEIITLMHDGKSMVVSTPDFTVLAPMIDENYPNTEVFWKKNTGKQIRIHTLEFLDIIKRLKLYAGEFSAINMTVYKDSILLNAIDKACEHSGQDQIMVDTGVAQEYVASFSIDKMIKVVSCFESEYFFLCHDPESDFMAIHILPDTGEVKNNKFFINMLMKTDAPQAKEKEVKKSKAKA